MRIIIISFEFKKETNQSPIAVHRDHFLVVQLLPNASIDEAALFFRFLREVEVLIVYIFESSNFLRFGHHFCCLLLHCEELLHHLVLGVIVLVLEYF